MHQLNSKNNVPVLLFKSIYLGIDFVSRIENGLKLRPKNKIQDIQQPDKYETDSDNESDEEGDFEVAYGRTCMTRSGRSVRDHDWCVCIPRLVSY